MKISIALIFVVLLAACNDTNSNKTVAYEPDTSVQAQSFLDEDTELAGLEERDCDDSDDLVASQ